jgi:hypothetical protein
MQKLYQLWQRFSQYKAALFIVLLVAAVLHIGTSVSGGLYADDYVHQAYFLGSEPLEAKGFLEGIGVGDFTQLLSNQFNFFNPHKENYAALKAFGMLPWWASEDALLHFFRPLATLTHYIDYQLWPYNTHLMHAQSLLWYLLGIGAIYALYRGVGVDKPIALFALFLLVLDHSMYQVVTWIASRSMLMVMAFGFFAVYAYHRSIQSRAWYLVALLALLLAALSAEAVIGICAYLGAYMFVLDKRLWFKRVLHIVPLALLIIIWHAYYQSQGYGAYGVDFYIDPGHEPIAFMSAAWYRLPGNFFELISGIDVVSGQIRPDIHHIAFAVLGLLSFLLFVYVLRPVFKQHPTSLFFFVGSCLSLIPGLTIALAPRVMILPFVGMAVVFSYVFMFVIQKHWQKKQCIVASGLAIYIGLMHLLVSLVLASLVTVNSIPSSHADKVRKPYGFVDLGVDDIADKPVILINSFRPFWLAFYAHHLVVQNQPLPSSLRVLSSAFYPITVTRVSERELLLIADPAFQFDTTSLVELDGRSPGHFAYLIQELMGLIRASRDEWQVGKVYAFEEMTITVIDLYKGKPRSLSVQLLHKNMSDYRWSYWHKETHRYEQFMLPEIGNSVEVEGIFNSQGF